MTITVWPAELVPQRVSYEIRNAWRSGGRTIYGREQRVRSDAGFWVVTLTGIRVADRDAEYAWRAMIARLRNGEAINVPVFGVRRLSHSADTDDSSLALAANAALRATEITIASSGIDVRAGGIVGLAGRIHTITEVVSAPASPPYQNVITNGSPWSDEVPWTDDATASAHYTVKIAPPLRAAFTAGQVLRAVSPTVRCVLENARDGDMDVQPGLIAFPNLTLIEDI